MMIKIFKTILALPVFLLHVSLVGMQFVQRVMEEKVPAITVAASLDFCWENEVVGQVPIEIAKAVSPVLKAKLNSACGIDRYRSAFRASEFSKESVALFVRALPHLIDHELALPQNIWRQMFQQPYLLPEFMELCKMYDVTYGLSAIFEQIFHDSTWYNAKTFPLPKESEVIKEIAHAVMSQHPYSMTITQEPMIVQYTRPVKIAEFSPNNRYVITGSEDCQVVMHDLKSSQVMWAIEYDRPVKSASFSSDSKHVVTVSGRTVRIYDVQSGQVIATINYDNGDARLLGWVAFSWVNPAKFSPNGRYVAMACLDHAAHIYDLQRGQVIATINHKDMIYSAEFSPNNQQVVTASKDGTAQIYDLEAQQIIGVVQHEPNSIVTSAKFSPNGRYVVTASCDETAQIYDLKEKQVIAIIRHDGCVEPAVFSPNSRYVATASWDKTVQIYDLQNKKNIGLYHSDPSITCSVVFSSDNKYVATNKNIYDLQADCIISTMNCDEVNANIFSSDCKYVLTYSQNNEVRIYDLCTNQGIGTIQHGNRVWLAAFSPDNKYVATASLDHTARITPLGFEDLTMPIDQILAIITLVRLALDRRQNQSLQIDLNCGSWTYNTFKQLPSTVKNRLQEQFPEIRVLMNPV